jgi:hypothetical protein
MKLSDYCTIERNGTAWIDIDTSWKFHCNLHGMEEEYAKLFIRRLSKKRRLYDEDELMEAEVTVPDMETQRMIVGAVKSAEKMWMAVGDVNSAYRELQQQTADPYYDEMRKYYSNLLGELHDHRFMLIDQLMGI